jgi:hypothetical protein
MSTQPILVLNPRQDHVFVRRARQLLTLAITPEALQVALREHYPTAVVRVRALASEVQTVWYVYRDGRWTIDRGEVRTTSA